MLYGTVNKYTELNGTDMAFFTSEARKIGVTHRSVSGAVADIGSYESTLERDFMELLRFDPGFKEIVPQPLTLQFQDQSGQQRSYTPDGLLTYRDDLQILPVLYEIKYRQDFRDSWKALLPKFRAAKQLASSRGWEFKVFTEAEIRTPFLKNAKFLWPYRHLDIEPGMKQHVLSVLSDLQESDPAMLIAALCSSKRNQAAMIPVIWHLVANFEIDCDLDLPLTMHSKIHTIGGKYE